MTNICQKVECPFFNNDHKRAWGCQRYSNSKLCHLLKVVPKAIPNEYAIFLPDDDPVDYSSLKRENNRCFAEDPYYQDRIEFQKEFPELFESGEFMVKRIDNPGDIK